MSVQVKDQEDGRVRPCRPEEIETVWGIINEAAEAYRGIIPADRWHEPYMGRDALQVDIAAGVVFWGYEIGGRLEAVMGIQSVGDVTLIRHAYVRPARQGQGIGSRLLATLSSQTARPILIGTWAAADWAIRFYEKHGFRQVTSQQKDLLLRAYWSIPERQIETSVVLAEDSWFGDNDLA